MVTGMATKKVTITLDEDRLGAIRDLVETGRASSVSGFVQDAVGSALDDLEGWAAILAGALEESGGPMSAEEREWADKALAGSTRPRSSVA